MYDFRNKQPLEEKMARKETTVKEAEGRAKGHNENTLKDLIIKEAMKLGSGEEHSVQQLMAYARRLPKPAPKKEDKK